MFTIIYEIREYIHEQRQHNQRILNMLTDINTRLDAIEDSVDNLSGDLIDTQGSMSNYKTINLTGTFTECS